MKNKVTKKQLNEATKYMINRWDAMTECEQEELCCGTGTLTLLDEAHEKQILDVELLTDEQCDYIMQRFNRHAFPPYEKQLIKAFDRVSKMQRHYIVDGMFNVLDAMIECRNIDNGKTRIEFTNYTISIIDLKTDRNILTLVVQEAL